MNYWVLLGGVVLIAVLGLLLWPVLRFVEIMLDAYMDEAGQ